MSETAAKLLEQIRELPEEDRQFISDELWDENCDSEDAIAEFETDPEFQAMLAERLRSVEEHPEQLIDGDSVLAEGRRLMRYLRTLNCEQFSPTT